MVTSTARSPARRPQPRTTSMPWSSAQDTCEESSWWLVKASRRARMASTSRDPDSMLATPGTLRAASSTSTGRSRALLGMHAQYEHSPPTSSASTMTAVRSLPWMAYWATFSPGGPPPITTTSHLSPGFSGSVMPAS